jgi:AcrR family transcriptional regulator
MSAKPDFFHSVWTRPPRARGGQPSLSREQIVRAAIELLDAEGTPGLSMRRLGTRLDAGATSLYWHVANKEELLELAVDEVLGEIYVPEAGDAPWRVSVSTFANGVRAALLRHPWVIGLLGTKPTLGPNAMRLGDRLIAVLTAAGFTGWTMSHVSALIHGHAIGSATTEAAATTALRRAEVPVNDFIRDLQPYLDQVSADHPHYDKWRRANPMDGVELMKMWEDSFAFGLDRILDGLEHWLATSKQS